MSKFHRVDRNKAYIIRSFTDPNVALRMMAMGIQPGQELRIIGKSPFGRCYYITVGNRRVAVRERELASIQYGVDQLAEH